MDKKRKSGDSTGSKRGAKNRKLSHEAREYTINSIDQSSEEKNTVRGKPAPSDFNRTLSHNPEASINTKDHREPWQKTELLVSVEDFFKLKPEFQELDDEEVEQIRIVQKILERRKLKAQSFQGSKPQITVSSKSLKDSPISSSTMNSISKAFATSKNPEFPPCVLQPGSLKPWSVADLTKMLPDIPPILDPALKSAVFTHLGMVNGDSSKSYERLEWLGDAYLYIISTLLISTTFTTHSPGKCAQIRELLVKNEQLAIYAKQYGFESQLRVPIEFLTDKGSGKNSAKSSGKVKVLGDVFEAYVAAVVLSDPQNGVETVSQWLRSLMSMTVANQIRAQAALHSKTQLNPTDSNTNPKELLKRQIGVKGMRITYEDYGNIQHEEGTGHPIYTVAVYVDAWDFKNRRLGVGSGKGKKEAGYAAAEMAMKDEETMTYLKKMKLEQREKEQLENAAL